MLLHVDPEAAPVAEPLVALGALVGLAPGVDVLMLLQQLVVVEPLATGPAHKLVIPRVLALVVTQTLSRGGA